jgi:type III secretory pathway component EscS
MKLLQEHLQHPKSATRADTCFLCSLFFLVVVLPIVLVAGIIGAIVVGIMAAVGKL